MQETYKNRFKIRTKNSKKDLDNFGSLYDGIFKEDAYLRSDEYWFHTNIDEKTIRDSILVELVD